MYLVLVLIAEMEFRHIIGWPKRAYYGESGVENDVFEATLAWGFGSDFSCFEAFIAWGKVQDRTAGNERERDRVREREREREKERYPSFQNRKRPRCGLVA